MHRKMRLVKFFSLHIFMLLLCNCSNAPPSSNGIAEYSYSISELPSKLLNTVDTTSTQHAITFHLKFMTLGNCQDYNLIISDGKNLIYKGECFETGIAKIPCPKTKYPKVLIFRLIDLKKNMVYQWNKKESYELCRKKVAFVRLNYNNEYQIRFDNQLFFR